MSVGAVQLTLAQGIASGFAWPMVDGAGAPAVLTGYTVKAQVRAAESTTSTLLFEFAAGVSGSSVTIQWTAAQSLTWSFRTGCFDVILISPAGVPVQIVAQGRVVVDPVVTAVTGV